MDTETRMSRRWICFVGNLKGVDFRCAVTIVYGLYSRSDKKELWRELVELRRQIDYPMIFIWDFNEVLHLDERENSLGCRASIEDFREWVQCMQLLDLPLQGRKFTWARGKSMSKLDRCFVDVEINAQFPKLRLEALNSSLSDHCPLFLESEKINWGPKSFRALYTWFSHPEFLIKVKQEWRSMRDLTLVEKM